MKNTLEKLRNKPVADRRSFAFVLASVLTGIVFFVWLLTFSTFDNKEDNSANSSGPFSNIMNQIKKLKNN